MQRNAFTLILTLLVAGGCGSQEPREFWVHPPGAEAARQDIERGHLELRFCGFPGSQTRTYTRLLKERFGVAYAWEGCSVSERYVEQMSEYNKVMEAEIARRFGAGALAELIEEARSTQPTTRPAA